MPTGKVTLYSFAPFLSVFDRIFLKDDVQLFKKTYGMDVFYGSNGRRKERGCREGAG